MMGHDPVQFGQRLDLVDDHLAHLRGVFGGFLRHFEHATAKLVARGIEFVVHFRGHLLHALHHRGKLFGRLLEHRIGFLRALPVDVVHRIGGQPAFLFRRCAHSLELPADHGRTGARCFRHHTCDIAGPFFRGRQQFVQQAGEPRQTLIQVSGTQIDRGHQRIQARPCVR